MYRDINYENKILGLKADSRDTLSYMKFLQHGFKHLKMEQRRKNPYWQEAFNDLLNRTYGNGFYFDDSGPYHLYALCRDAGKKGFQDEEKRIIFERHKKYIYHYVSRPEHLNNDITWKHLDYYKSIVMFCQIFTPFFTMEDAQMFENLNTTLYDCMTLVKITNIDNLDEDFKAVLQVTIDKLLPRFMMDKLTETKK